MVLVDTSVWVEHLRGGSGRLGALLEEAEVLCHPFVVGELACGHLRKREEILALLSALPRAPEVSNGEALTFIEKHRLMGRGLGLIDVHLLASAMLAGVPIWTEDRALRRTARALGLG